MVTFITLQTYGYTTHMFLFDNLVYLLLFSFLLGIPAGSIYSSSLYQANAGGNIKEMREQKYRHLRINERETAVNLLFIMMDAGSLSAQVYVTYMLVNHH
jgi:hypothetical protein